MLRRRMTPEAVRRSRVLVFRDHWRNVGMGFMPGQIQNVLHFGLSTGFQVYFENYGRYDWQRYFYGHGGMSLRWTHARARLWRHRFRSIGVLRPKLIEVKHEDSSGLGDDEWEESLVAALSNASTPWIVVNGWATVVSYVRVFAPAVKALRAANALAPIPVPSRTNASGPAATSQLPLLQALADFHLCRHCALIGALRPRRVLRRALTGSPVEQGKPLVCLKARTMYAEDKRFFPDDLPLSFAATDSLWVSYPDKMRDESFWGPRPRLRCKPTGPLAGSLSVRDPSGIDVVADAMVGARVALLDASSAGQPTTEGLAAFAASYAQVRSRAIEPDPKTGQRLILPSEAVGCARRLRKSLGSGAVIFVAVDAPRLQELLLNRLGTESFITPGTGVDPTNVFRDGDTTSSESRVHYKGQVTGKQDLQERNLIKVSLDYYLQGFCVTSLVLRSSAFYAAAVARTDPLRPMIIANATSRLVPKPGTCAQLLHRIGQADSAGMVRSSLAACQPHECNLRRCNLEAN